VTVSPIEGFDGVPVMSRIIKSGISPDTNAVEMKIGEIDINNMVISKDVKIADLIGHPSLFSSIFSRIFGTPPFFLLFFQEFSLFFQKIKIE
jgi:hypothetical protein